MQTVFFIKPKNEALYQYALKNMPNNALLQHVDEQPDDNLATTLFFNQQNQLILQCQNEQVSIDFASGKNYHRLLFGGGKQQPIAKACGLNKHKNWSILDATAGLAQDAFVLASLNPTGKITLVEQHPALFSLIQFARLQALDNEKVCNIVKRMQVFNANSVDFMQANPQQYEVIYLDPMYPERKKQAKVKKGMLMLQQVIGHTQDEALLLQTALDSALKRVVVKRPKSAPFYAQQPPSYQCTSKNTRYDVYVV